MATCDGWREAAKTSAFIGRDARPATPLRSSRIIEEIPPGGAAMTLSTLLLVLAVGCACWSVVAAIAITGYLDRRGMPTPFPFIRFYLLRNLKRYRELTERETGRPGPLYRLYLGPILAAFVFAVTGIVLRGAGF
jgi:hypothetical protein